MTHDHKQTNKQKNGRPHPRSLTKVHTFRVPVSVRFVFDDDEGPAAIDLDRFIIMKVPTNADVYVMLLLVLIDMD